MKYIVYIYIYRVLFTSFLFFSVFSPILSRVYCNNSSTSFEFSKLNPISRSDEIDSSGLDFNLVLFRFRIHKYIYFSVFE